MAKRASAWRMGAERGSDIAGGQNELPLFGEAAELLGISRIRKRLIEAATRDPASPIRKNSPLCTPS